MVSQGMQTILAGMAGLAIPTETILRQTLTAIRVATPSLHLLSNLRQAIQQRKSVGSPTGLKAVNEMSAPDPVYSHMADSTTAGDVPDKPEYGYVAGYVNGKYLSYEDLVKRFGNRKRVVAIDVLGTDPTADVLDIEPGNVGVDGAVKWVKDKLALKGSDLPVLYVNRGNVTKVFNAMEAAGYKVTHHFLVWMATLDGTKSIEDMTGVVAVQYAGVKQTGGHWDASWVYNTGWLSSKGPQTPVATPVPVAKKTVASVVVHYSDGTTVSLP